MDIIKQYEPLWGAWYVDTLIGEGAYGKVYQVSREEFGSKYYAAVKIISIPQSISETKQLLSEGMDEASIKSYFQGQTQDILKEINLMERFKGTGHVVGFEDHKVLEKADGAGYDILVRMELLESLNQRAMSGALTAAEVVKMGIHICRALELCAQQNTVHRDIKPDNIFVSRYGEYKLGDFGIARQIERTMSGLSKKGTYSYMAPEVYKGDDYSASVDTYSLGIVMYRFLNKNRVPFLPDFPTPIAPRDREMSLLRRMKGEAIPPISGIDSTLNAIVLKACAYDRKARFASPAEMREVLETVADEKSIPSAVTPTPIANEITNGESSAVESKSAITDTAEPKEKTTSLFGDGEPSVLVPQNLSDQKQFIIETPISADEGVIDRKQEKAQTTPSIIAPAESKGFRKNKKQGGFVVAIVAVFLATSLLFPIIWGKEASPARRTQAGNTLGNIINGGYIALQDDRIYYSFGEGLYSAKPDGSDSQKLCDDKASYINVVGDRIYFSNNSAGLRLYSIRTDGGDKQKIYDDMTSCINVVGDCIYYRNITEGEKLYAIKTDGSQRKKLSDDAVRYINAVDDRIYYSSSAGESGLFSIKTDGSDWKRINMDVGGCFNVVGDWIYYTRHDGIYAVKVDGSGQKKLCDGTAYSINVAGGRIFYSESNSGVSGLFSIKTDGSDLKKLSDDNAYNIINVAGDRIYYRNQSKGNEFYTIKTDGSGKLPMSDFGRQPAAADDRLASDVYEPSFESNREIKWPSQRGQELADYALSMLDKPYLLGGFSEDGFDPSGLVWYSLNAVGIPLERMTSKAYSEVYTWSTLEDMRSLQPGELLFYLNEKKTTIDRVGIYVGGDDMVYASASKGKVVRDSISREYWVSRFVIGKRIF